MGWPGLPSLKAARGGLAGRVCQDSQLCEHPSLSSCVHWEPCSVCCTPSSSPSTATTMLCPHFTGAPPAARHTPSHGKTLPAAPGSFGTGHSEGVSFCTSHCSSCKMPRGKWLVSHSAVQLQSHKFLWSNLGSEEKKGQRKGSSAGQSYGRDQSGLQSHHNSLKGGEINL